MEHGDAEEARKKEMVVKMKRWEKMALIICMMSIIGSAQGIATTLMMGGGVLSIYSFSGLVLLSIIPVYMHEEKRKW